MKENEKLIEENSELKTRLAEAEELLAAIRSGAVDALITDNQTVFTLKGADYTYKKVVETMNEGAATITREGTLLYCNNSLAEIFGQPIQNVIGTSIFSFFKEKDHPRLKKIFESADIATSRTGIDILRKDGVSVPILLSCSYLALDTPALCLVITDLREIKNAQKSESIQRRGKENFEKIVQERTSELLKAQLELERSKRLSDIGVLAATVAHELRNPLAAIGIAAHNIKRKVKDPNIDKRLSNIEKKVFESDQIINNLLFYSRIKPPIASKVRIYDLLKECIDIAGKRTKANPRVETKLDQIKDIYIYADAVQIKEVFSNLLGNAYDAIEKPEGLIVIKGVPYNSYIKIIIRDNGIGIPETAMPKIFETFFTTKSKGTGLGLSVCKQIITLHEGDIDIKSKVNIGTVVTVKLPRERLALSDPKALTENKSAL